MKHEEGDLKTSESRDRIIEVAETLFARRGLAAVTLRDISAELGITHASLYYHFPKGKEELFVEVTERSIRRHGEGLAAAIAAGGPGLRGELYGAADWLLGQPPMDLIRMAETDMPALPREEARRLMDLVHEEILVRLRRLFETAAGSGELGYPSDPGLLGGAILGFVESLHSVPEFAVMRTRFDMAKELIDIILRGLGYREGGRT
jgi:AcrR family transcriptional regulator